MSTKKAWMAPRKGRFLGKIDLLGHAQPQGGNKEVLTEFWWDYSKKDAETHQKLTFLEGITAKKMLKPLKKCQKAAILGYSS